MTTTTQHSTKSDVRAFILSDAVTQFGAGMVLSASAWYIFDNSHSNTLVAVAATFNTISGVLMSIVAGSIVDRFPPKVVAQVSHLLRIALIVIPLALITSFDFHPAFVFILALNNGLGWNLYFPASKAIIQRLTQDDGAVVVNSAAEVSMQVGLFSSGAVAGLIYRSTGFGPILVASTLAFILGMGILATVNVPEIKAAGEDDQTESFGRAFRAGFRYLHAHPTVLTLSLVLYAPFIIANIFATALPGYVQSELHHGAVAYGVIDMAWGLGATAAGILVVLVARRRHESRVVVASLALITCFGVVMMINSSVGVAIAVTAIAGASAASARILLYSEVMRIVPGAYLGRVIALANLASLLLQTVLSQVAGLLMDATQPRYGFFVAVVVGLAAGLTYTTFVLRRTVTTAPATAER